ncbi:mechanosensitive ion channel [Roseibium salinum]|nr:mechanosensitive ion channel [Roseibium salinum]
MPACCVRPFASFSLAIALVVLGYGATQIGIPIYGVIAGLGVGGLAIALAAQPTIENLIGGIILYADGMVRVGEFCQFDELSGTIEIHRHQVNADPRTRPDGHYHRQCGSRQAQDHQLQPAGPVSFPPPARASL